MAEDFRLQNTMNIYPKLMTLPLHPDLDFDDIEYIIQEINSLLSPKKVTDTQILL